MMRYINRHYLSIYLSIYLLLDLNLDLDLLISGGLGLGLQWQCQGGARRGTCPGCKTLLPGCATQLSYDDVDHKQINFLKASDYYALVN